MRIAVLGWGSLVWDLQGLPLKGDWQEGGPTLPIEFSRISRDCRLTLVIDPTNGTPVSTRYALSARESLNDAISDLVAREQTTQEHIGYIDLKQQAEHCIVHRPAAEIIRTWARSLRFDAVIWTDLAPNFQQKTGGLFSPERAEEYLRGLPQSAAARAREYIARAPAEVDTPLRRRLEQTNCQRPKTSDVLSQIERLEKFVDSLEMIPAGNLYRSKVLLALISKALTVSRAVCALVDSNFPGEAFGLSRTVIEIFFCIRYISNKDTEKRAQIYAEYFAKCHAIWSELIQKHYPAKKIEFPLFHEELMEMAQGHPSHNWTRQGGQAKLMAMEESSYEKDKTGTGLKSEFEYEAIY